MTPERPRSPALSLPINVDPFVLMNLLPVGGWTIRVCGSIAGPPVRGAKYPGAPGMRRGLLSHGAQPETNTLT